jgi:hypothetical protein
MEYGFSVLVVIDAVNVMAAQQALFWNNKNYGKLQSR